jgi:hypothetical protein
MQADANRRPEPVWKFYMSEGIALRALASVAKTEEVRGQLLRIADMYDQLANYLKGPEPAQAPDARVMRQPS